MKKNIEIEMRARFNREKYKELEKFLKNNAVDLGKDDKDVCFYIMEDKLLKVSDNKSRGDAKITLKLNRIGKGSHFEEIEFPIDKNDSEKAKKLFDHLDCFKYCVRSFQKRHNFLYKGVEIALKYSKNWGYHLELEVIINNLKQKIKAENLIRKIAGELKVKLMSEEDLNKFNVEFEKKNNLN